MFCSVFYSVLRQDGVVFNILNQTKMLFTALFVYLIVGRRQSRMQCVALLIISMAGVLVSYSQISEVRTDHSLDALSMVRGLKRVVNA